jgi:hypothetical protein
MIINLHMTGQGRSVIDSLNSLSEDMIMLCEIRGELDPESNAQVEVRIAALQKQIDELRTMYEKE